MIKHLIVPLACVFLTACYEPSPPDLVSKGKDIGQRMNTCYVKQVLKDDCDSFVLELKKLELEIKTLPKSAEVTKDMIFAAVELGGLEVDGKPENSIYSKVLKAFHASKHPGLTLEKVNYEIFTGKCLSYSDIQFYQRFTTIDYGSRKFKAYYYLLNNNCFSVEDMQDDFLIITQQQAEKLAKDYEENVTLFNSHQEAKEAKEAYAKLIADD